MTMAGVLADIGSCVTAMLSWAGDVLDVVTGNPLLLLMAVGSFGLIAVGIVKRLIRL